MRLHRAIPAFLAILLSLSSAWAQPLNSERIEQTFGSYGIDVVYADDETRISNLYSLHDGVKFTRTLAFVGLPADVERAIAQEHQAIVDGGSIGAVFRDAGWAVIKTGHSYFTASLPPPVLEGMRIAGDMQFAAHGYRLEVAKGEQAFDYALIIEIHHPDYLVQADLEEIYGPEETGGMHPAIRRLLGSGTERFTRYGLTLPD